MIFAPPSSWLRLGGVWLLLILSAAADGLPEPQTMMTDLLRRHPSIRKAEHLVQMAEAELSGSRLQPNPVLTVSAYAGDPTEETNTLTQSLDISGQPRLRHEQAQRRLEAAQFQFHLARRTVAGWFYSAWLELWKSQHLAVMSRLRLTLINDMTRVAHRRFEVGEIPQNEALRVELAAAEALSDAKRAEADYLSAYRAFAILSGQSGQDSESEPQPLPPAPATPEELKNLLRGPDLALGQSDWSLEQALQSTERHLAVEAMKSEYQALQLGSDLVAKERAPQLGLSLYRSKFAGSGVEQGAMLSLSFPLFDWGSISAKKRAKEFEAQAQLAASEERLWDLRREVAQLWHQWSAAKSVREVLVSQADRYEELAREARIGYDLGMLSLTDVLQTESEFRQAGVKLIEAQVEVYQLELELLSRTDLPWPAGLLEEQ